MGFQSLLPSDPSQLTDQVLEYFNSMVLFCQNYLSSELIELIVELRLWYRRLARLEKDELPKYVISALKHCKVLLPMSTENERSSSTLRRTKTYLRSCTSENTLNGLTLLFCICGLEVLLNIRHSNQTLDRYRYLTLLICICTETWHQQ